MLKKLGFMKATQKQEELSHKFHTLNFIHRNKLVTKMQKVIMNDIVNTIQIVCSENKLIVPDINVNSIIIKSLVDGHVGWYTIFDTEFDLLEVKGNILLRMKMTNLYLEDKEPLYVVFNSLTTHNVVIEAGGFINNKFKFTDYILATTQAERLDIMEYVSEMMIEITHDYKFRGYTVEKNIRKDLI